MNLNTIQYSPATCNLHADYHKYAFYSDIRYTHTHTARQPKPASARPMGQPAVLLGNQPCFPWSTPRPYGVPGGGSRERKGEGGRRTNGAPGKVYVTQRQEPEGQTLYQLSLDSVSCLSVSLFLPLYMSFSLDCSSAVPWSCLSLSIRTRTKTLQLLSVTIKSPADAFHSIFIHASDTQGYTLLADPRSVLSPDASHPLFSQSSAMTQWLHNCIG